MIKSVELHNFEGHINTHIDWDKGFCVLSGTSGAGKSSIRRAITWVVTNRPSNTSIINWDCFDKKGNLNNTCTVTLIMENGNSVTRERSPTFNGYKILHKGATEEKVLEAIGRDIPEEVTLALGFTDVNCQAQFDRPFLIDMSSGDVAKYINKLVNMEDADLYQSNVEQKRKANDKELKRVTFELEEHKTKLQEYSWIEGAQKTVAKYNKVSKESDAMSDTINGLTDTFREVRDLQRTIDNTSNYVNVFKVIEALEEILQDPISKEYDVAVGKLQSAMDAKELYEASKGAVKAKELIKSIKALDTTEETNSIDKLENSLQEYNDNKVVVDKGKNINSIMVSLQQLPIIMQECEELTNKTNKMDKALDEIRQLQYSKTKVKERMKVVMEELSSIKVCPYCGNELKGE